MRRVLPIVRIPQIRPVINLIVINLEFHLSASNIQIIVYIRVAQVIRRVKPHIQPVQPARVPTIDQIQVRVVVQANHVALVVVVLLAQVRGRNLASQRPRALTGRLVRQVKLYLESKVTIVQMLDQANQIFTIQAAKRTREQVQARVFRQRRRHLRNYIVSTIYISVRFGFARLSCRVGLLGLVQVKLVENVERAQTRLCLVWLQSIALESVAVLRVRVKARVGDAPFQALRFVGSFRVDQRFVGREQARTAPQASRLVGERCWTRVLPPLARVDHLQAELEKIRLAVAVERVDEVVDLVVVVFGVVVVVTDFFMFVFR